MTPNFVTGLAFAAPTADQIHLILQAPDPQLSTSDELGFATITVGSRQQAQGPVLRRYRDGRISINAGGRIVTGLPLNPVAPRSWWSRISGQHS